jgi:hypothetical protein
MVDPGPRPAVTESGKYGKYPALLRVILLAISLTSGLFASPPDTCWTRAYSNGDYDDCFSVCQLSDGTYIAVGGMTISSSQTTDAWLLKLDAEGDTQWTRTYGDQYTDDAHAVQLTRDGGYIIAGSYGINNLPLNAPWLIKTDANGSTVWMKTYGFGFAYGVQQTFDGGYVLVADHYGYGVLLVKTDANGDTLWTAIYNGPDTIDEGYAVVQTPDSGLAALADSASYSTGGLWFLRTDANGDTLWTRRFWGDSGGRARVGQNSLAATADGGFAIVASTSTDYHSWHTRLIRLDGNGDTLWTRMYQGETEVGYTVQQTLDGGFVIAGTANNALTDGNDIWLVRTDGNGETLWTKTVGGPGNEHGYSVWQTSDSGYIVAGTTTSYGGTKAYFVKTTPDRGAGVEDEATNREGLPQSRHDRSLATVYDASGRRICRISNPAATGHRLPVGLTGRLAPGVYFIHSETGMATLRLKTVFIR